MVDGHKRKGWRELESTADAVKRLTAMIDERNAKRRLAGAETPAEIQDFPWSPGKNADGASDRGSGTLKRRPQRPAAGGWEDSDGVGNECDRVLNRRKLGGGRMAIDHRLGSDRSQSPDDSSSRSRGCAPEEL
jgi:hypothetical protein